MSCDKSATRDDSSVTNDSLWCRITVMQDLKSPKSPSRAALSGWRWLVAWSFLVGTLTLIIRGVVEFTATGFWREVPWIVSFVVAFAIVLLIGIAVKCFTSWRNFRILLIAVACTAGLIVLFYAEEDLRGRVLWNHFKANLEKKGDRFDFASLIPPAVPDEKNFATVPIVATSYEAFLDRHGTRKVPADTNVANLLKMPFDAGGGAPTKGFGNWRKGRPADLAEWQQYYHELSKTTNTFPVSSGPQTSAADVLLALSIYSNRVEELRVAAELPESRFPLSYGSQEPFLISLPHLAGLKSPVALLEARALAESEAGQSQAALDDISLGLRLTDKIRSEPFLISHLVRIAMLQIMIQPIWEGLAQHRWDDRQLAELDRLLSAFDFVADYQAALRGENACGIATIDYLRRLPGKANEFVNFLENDDDRAAKIIYVFAPTGWFYQNQRTTAKFITEHLLPIANPTNHAFSSAAITNAENILNQMPAGPYTALAKMVLPPVRAAYKFALAQDSVNLSKTACALERYRLAQHHFPPTLDALVPSYIAAVPNDTITAQPLRYRLENDGSYVMYAVGQNGTDEGGIVVSKPNGLVDLEQGDVVWRYPETSPH